MFIRRKKVQSIGLILLGLLSCLPRWDGFEYLANPLKEIRVIDQLLGHLNNSHLLSVIAGAIITGIIQSSTATVGIIMGFLSNGVMNIDTGIAIMLGSNIGMRKQDQPNQVST